MDPLSLMLGVSGLALQLGGAIGGYGASQQINASQQREAQLQMQVEQQKRQFMEFSSRRQSVENLRTTQQKAAMSLNTAVNQGANFSSGYAGGRAQVMGQGNWNEAGIAGSLAIGENIFDINSKISQEKLIQSQYGSSLATDKGLSSLGGALIGSINPLKQLTGFGSTQPGGGGMTSSANMDLTT